MNVKPCKCRLCGRFAGERDDLALNDGRCDTCLFWVQRRRDDNHARWTAEERGREDARRGRAKRERDIAEQHAIDLQRAGLRPLC